VNEYVVIYEQAGDGSWSAHAADMVFASGDTREEAESQIRDAIAFHIQVLREEGEEVPPPGGVPGVVSVEAP
jgi:predicted RNase H-like HicB family nuclease